MLDTDLITNLITYSVLAAGAEAHDWQVLAEGLGKAYGRGPWEAPVQALSALWLGVGAGSCFGLLGVNGAGKTTAFRLLTGAGACHSSVFSRRCMHVKKCVQSMLACMCETIIS